MRNLPLKLAGSQVHLYNGNLKANQQLHAAVIDIDVGQRDLQQCADACMRLRAEYLYEFNQPIAFNYTSGHEASWEKWQAGYRPKISGSQVIWHKTKEVNSSYENFRAYLDNVFTYCGTYSLSRDLPKIEPKALQIGDIFLQGGFPGHAVIIVDMAVSDNNEPIFLLAQSYMPAQEIHLLKNLEDNSISPWFHVPKDELLTPEWIFEEDDCFRF